MHSENEGNSREIKTDKLILFFNINTISQHENKDRYMYEENIFLLKQLKQNHNIRQKPV